MHEQQHVWLVVAVVVEQLCEKRVLRRTKQQASTLDFPQRKKACDEISVVGEVAIKTECWSTWRLLQGSFHFFRTHFLFDFFLLFDDFFHDWAALTILCSDIQSGYDFLCWGDKYFGAE